MSVAFTIKTWSDVSCQREICFRSGPSGQLFCSSLQGFCISTPFTDFIQTYNKHVLDKHINTCMHTQTHSHTPSHSLTHVPSGQITPRGFGCMQLRLWSMTSQSCEPVPSPFPNSAIILQLVGSAPNHWRRYYTPLFFHHFFFPTASTPLLPPPLFLTLPSRTSHTVQFALSPFLSSLSSLQSI